MDNNVRNIGSVKYETLRQIITTLVTSFQGGLSPAGNNRWRFGFTVPGLQRDAEYSSPDEAYDALIGALYAHAQGMAA
jgi:hypothetical protein